jgi:hypothetical protein
MDRDTLKNRPRILLGLIAGLIVILTFSGCWKKSGQAVVLEKEHIAAAEPTPTPAAAAEQSARPNASSPSPGESPAEEGRYETRELAEDEIVVETYVMKKDARGTSRDPRATRDEQWIVNVRIEGLRQVKVQTDQRHYDKLKVGDRVKVSYRQGKYTGTVWWAEIE